MLKKFFWSKYMTWFRKLVSLEKPDINMEEILEATKDPNYRSDGSIRNFSGADVKVYFEDENEKFLVVPEVQSIRFDFVWKDETASGDITTLNFDEQALANLPFKPKNMLLVAADEYGVMSYTKFFDIEFDFSFSGISIDDLLSETRTTFRAAKCKPWTSLIHKGTRYDNWEDNTHESKHVQLASYK